MRDLPARSSEVSDLIIGAMASSLSSLSFDRAQGVVLFNTFTGIIKKSPPFIIQRPGLRSMLKIILGGDLPAQFDKPIDDISKHELVLAVEKVSRIHGPSKHLMAAKFLQDAVFLDSLTGNSVKEIYKIVALPTPPAPVGRQPVKHQKCSICGSDQHNKATCKDVPSSAEPLPVEPVDASAEPLPVEPVDAFELPGFLQPFMPTIEFPEAEEFFDCLG